MADVGGAPPSRLGPGVSGEAPGGKGVGRSGQAWLLTGSREPQGRGHRIGAPEPWSLPLGKPQRYPDGSGQRWEGGGS